MALSTLPLSYCTNVHPGRSVDEITDGLRRYTAPVRERTREPIAAGLWLAASVVRELSESTARIGELQAELERSNLSCHTLNTFPYGDFHSPRVKENVYLPDWTDPRRLEYTEACARILSELLPSGVEGSLSTVPLGFKEFPASRDPGHRPACILQLLQLAQELYGLAQDGGPVIRLAIEPEPFCLLETTPETIAFFEELYSVADASGAGAIAREFLGVCYDVCHQAVEFEDVPASIASLERAGIRIYKVHITSAIELTSPGTNIEGRRALAKYVEERYLHQTLARTRSGAITRVVDLTEDLALNPPPEFRDADAWRVHFHVPVNLESLGAPGLRTTRAELRQALQAIAGLPYSPHLEVETYTWPVLPGSGAAAGNERLIGGLSAEITATRDMLEALKGS